MGRGVVPGPEETTYVALLRGINVGRARQVAMDELRALVSSLGHRDVRTLLRSGNVVFRGPSRDVRDVAKELERAIAVGLSLSVGVVVRTAAQLADVVAADPLPDGAADGTSLHVMLLAAPLTAEERSRLDPEEFLPDEVRVADHGMEVYVRYRNGMSGSKTAARLDRRIKTLATDRNWNTVTKLLAMVGPAEG